MNKISLVYLLAVTLLLGGCESTPSAPSKTVTPLDSCLQEVKDRHWNCIVGALAPSGSFRFDPVLKNICEDRKMQQEDRCHARFK